MNFFKNVFVILLFSFISYRLQAAPVKVKFNQARIYVPLKGSTMTAGYLNITNASDKEIEVKLKTVEKFKAFETHETTEESGVMSMKKVESFIVKKGQTLKIEPGGRHLMLFDPVGKIAVGSNLKVILLIDNVEQAVLFKVVTRESETDAHHH